MELIDRLCSLAGEQGASDVFLHSGRSPQFRIQGQLVPIESEPVSEEEVDSFWAACRAPADAIDFDASFVATNGTRYRVNLFRSLEKRGAVLRPIKTEIAPLASLGLPVSLLTSWITRPSGIILVTGATGSGKSTTLASCLQWLNQNHARHIVTIEDPIEYLFRSEQCLFTQREVGSDTPTFAEGLRRSLRQSPDIILLGEIRDGLSAVAALQAAETGHLVLATLHSSNVPDSLERLARLFDQPERTGVLQVLSQQLIGVLCQKLVEGQDGGLALVVEHFENQAVTRKWIMEDKFNELADFLARGEGTANVTFLKSLVEMVQAGRISEATALGISTNPHELQRLLKGIGSHRF